MNNVFVCIGYTKINWQNLLPFYESAWRKVKKADQDTVMSICTQQSKKKACNTEKVQTYEGHETGNRPMTAYLCTCSKIL